MNMYPRIIWLTALVFVSLHLAISIGAALDAAASDMPEWGMSAGAYLTTLPLADGYDWLLDRPGIPILIQVAVPILVGAVLYGMVGASVGWGIDRINRYRNSQWRDA